MRDCCSDQKLSLAKFFTAEFAEVIAENRREKNVGSGLAPTDKIPNKTKMFEIIYDIFLSNKKLLQKFQATPNGVLFVGCELIFYKESAPMVLIHLHLKLIFQIPSICLSCGGRKLFSYIFSEYLFAQV
ncbi:MAG: hypothetical protein N3F03_08030 [Ignavibacteria bacterium]|nr:hypothetical protein [Ignavibacteria bacterium]